MRGPSRTVLTYTCMSTGMQRHAALFALSVQRCLDVVSSTAACCGCTTLTLTVEPVPPMVVAPTLLLNTRKLESPDACCRAACTSAAPLKSQEPAPDCADAHASRHAYPIASIKRAGALSLPRRGSVVGRTRSHMVAPCCDACRWQGVARVFSSKPARSCVLWRCVLPALPTISSEGPRASPPAGAVFALDPLKPGPQVGLKGHTQVFC